MGVDYTAKSGFGYKISCEEWSKSSLTEWDLNIGQSAELPEGFEYFEYGNAYIDDGEGIVICTEVDLSKSLRGVIPLPNVSPILEWAKKHGINFENEKPELYTELYIW